MTRYQRNIMYFAVVILSLTMPTQPAAARDPDRRYANSPLKGWFEGLKNKNGGQCCADADGSGVGDDDWDTKAGHYRVRIKGTWYDVPDDAVLEQPNKAGQTMVWTSYYEGSVFIRCFIPGSMT